MKVVKVALDAAIFFFCFKSDRSDIKPDDMRRLLSHLSNDPRITLYVPISVLGESVIECLRETDHGLDELHEMIDFWGSLDLEFLYPSTLVAEACYKLAQLYKQGEKIDYRLSDTDLVHLGYALAYNMDFFLTTDTKLKHYIPEKSTLQVSDHKEIRKALLDT